MGNLAVDVVKHTRLRDTVGGIRAELSHDGAEITKRWRSRVARAPRAKVDSGAR